MYPSHVHLQGTVLTTRNTIDEHNRNCIPWDDHPLLFPCKCQVTLQSQNPSSCNGNSSPFADNCWAKEINKCPKLVRIG